ncbi:autotransporter domain-containing protein [Salmonella enterica]|nr:autotransporter domain-containing protein [Salmonella enterica]
MNGKLVTLVALLPAVSVASGGADRMAWHDITTRPSTAMFISADGSVVAGSLSGADGPRLFLYDGKGVTDPGTLKAGNTGSTVAFALSADGRVVVGMSDSGTDRRGFVHMAGETGLTDTGTLKADNTGSAIAYGVSANGSVVVGGAESDNSLQRAFRYLTATGDMYDLGSLTGDSSSTSVATAVSANGLVIAGQADTVRGTRHAFRWTEKTGMSDLGTLKQDGGGNSWSQFVSADGRVVAGQSETDTGGMHVFRYNAGGASLTDPGTLMEDNSGNAILRDLSADGRVMVGQASATGGVQHAFRHNEGDARLTDLGTLRSDGTGTSLANAVSEDGNVVVGTAEADGYQHRAFWHYAGEERLTDLGTLRSDNYGASDALAVSADGTVIAGQAVTDDGSMHATLWKVTLPGPAPDVKTVDVSNSHRAMAALAIQAENTLALYESNLKSLISTHCLPGQNYWCSGVYVDYETVRSHDSTLASGLYGAVRFAQAPRWTAGVSVRVPVNTRLAAGYDAIGGNKPGMGAYIRYQSTPEGYGLNMEVSGAFLRQDMSIRRQVLANTEAGQGKTEITGKAATLQLDYGLDMGDSLRISPLLGLRYQDVQQDGYTESTNIVFPVTYDSTGRTTTDLLLGLEAEKWLNSGLYLKGRAGTEISLHRDNDIFRGSLAGGEFQASDNRTQDVRPYLEAGGGIQLNDTSRLGIWTGWRKTDWREEDLNIQMGYTIYF